MFDEKESTEILVGFLKFLNGPEVSVLEYYKLAINIVIEINLKEMLNLKGNSLRTRNEQCIYKEILLQLQNVRNDRYENELYLSYSLREDIRRSKMELVEALRKL